MPNCPMPNAQLPNAPPSSSPIGPPPPSHLRRDAFLCPTYYGHAHHAHTYYGYAYQVRRPLLPLDGYTYYCYT